MSINYSLNLFVQLAILVSVQSFTCRNEEGESIDWFAAYKVPRLEPETGPNPVINGAGLFTADVKNVQWSLSSNNVTQTSGQHISETLAPLYKTLTDPSITYIIYNDEFPDGEWTTKYGHTKGVVAFNETSGFWLIHSVPKFPGNTSYSYPHTGEYYGQAGLCITFDADQLPKIATQLLYTSPYIYAAHVSKSVSEKIPQFNLILAEKFVTSPPFFNIASFKSASGVDFVHFAKSKQFGDDLYAALVAQNLKADINVESWLNGHENLHSNCSLTNSVYNIYNVTLPNAVSFTVYHDHSKYAVSNSGNNPWICIGDINREATQFKRAGGTMCTKHSGLHSTFYKSIGSVYPCDPMPK